jgi:drug/metabolite transporter (DMT)-like permease
MGITWVLLAAVLFGVGSVAQAAVLADGASWSAMLRHPAFVAGTLAEGLGALAHVMALQTVSMAVAQCAVSGSLAVTALAARWWFGTRLGLRGITAIGALSVSLVVLASVAGESGTATDTAALEVGLVVTAAVVGLAGLAGVVARRAWLVGVCSGLGFAACSTAVKLVDLTHPLSALTSAPALAAAVTGALGCVWWTVALRLGSVTTVTAVVVVAEVVPPSLLGPLLGDDVSSAFYLVAPLVLAVAALACVVLARGGAEAPAPVVGTVPEAVPAL